MISEAEFVRQVTEAGHASQLRRMTIPELDKFCQEKKHELCVYRPNENPLKDLVAQIVELEHFNYDSTNMFVTKEHRNYNFCRHERDIAWLDESGEWAGYDYYVIPCGEVSLDIEELI